MVVLGFNQFICPFQVQSTNKDLPDDLHSLHSKYKSLEQESTNLKINLNNVIITTSNLTQQTAQLHQKLNQLDQVIDLGPNTKQLPTDVEQLRKVRLLLHMFLIDHLFMIIRLASFVKMIADINTQIGSTDNDSKLWKEQQKNLELRMNAFDSRLQLLEQNLSAMSNNQSIWNQKIEQLITVIDNQMATLNESFANLSTSLSNMSNESLIERHSIHQNDDDNQHSEDISAKTNTLIPTTTHSSLEPNEEPIGTGRIHKKMFANIDNLTESDNVNHM